MATYSETLAQLNALYNEAQKESSKKRSGSCDQAYECGKINAYTIALRLLKDMDLRND